MNAHFLPLLCVLFLISGPLLIAVDQKKDEMEKVPDLDLEEISNGFIKEEVGAPIDLSLRGDFFMGE